MKTIISFVSILVAIVMFSGCTPGSIANLGMSLLESRLEAKSEDAKARRQAKYIAEEIQTTTNPADKALKNAKESIIKTKGKPNNVVKIDDAGSEVWEYYNSPEKGKVRLYAFLKGELKNVGSRNMDEYSANSNDMAFLKKRYTNTVPCYASLRSAPIMEAHSLDLQPKEVATSFGTLKLGRDGDTLEEITKKMGQKPSEQEITHGEADTDSVAVFYKDGNTFVFGLYGGKTVLYAEKTGILSLKDALASAGITPATIPEPTPAPAKTIPLGPIPTTGFMPR